MISLFWWHQYSAFILLGLINIIYSWAISFLVQLFVFLWFLYLLFYTSIINICPNCFAVLLLSTSEHIKSSLELSVPLLQPGLVALGLLYRRQPWTSLYHRLWKFPYLCSLWIPYSLCPIILLGLYLHFGETYSLVASQGKGCERNLWDPVLKCLYFTLAIDLWFGGAWNS